MEFKTTIVDGSGQHEVSLGLDLYKSEKGFAAELNSRFPTPIDMPTAAEQVFAHTIELGGTLSGEHGIGFTKRDYLHMEQSEQVLAWQRKWKAMWDPTGLLNPGKVIPARKTACTE